MGPTRTVAAEGDTEVEAAFAAMELVSAQLRATVDVAGEWRRRRGPFTASAVGHTCTADCQLEPIAAERFGCTLTGAVHVCGLDTCVASMLVNTGYFVCGLTGIELGRVLVHAWSEALGNPRPTGGNAASVAAQVQFTKRRTSHSRSRKPAVRAVIGAVITAVLRNPGEAAIIAARMVTVQAHAHRAVRQYGVVCAEAGTLPSMVAVEDLMYATLRRAQLWQRQPCTPERAQFYTDIICNLWSTAANLPTRQHTELHMQVFALGCLYKMQHGIDIRGQRLLPVDEWLVHNLPLACDIPSYGFPKRYVTKGRNALLSAFKTLVCTNKLHRSDMVPTRRESLH
jgi:hypothetical protein